MFKVILIGKSNVGKSSLFNVLCRQRISMVHNSLNTTVDTVEKNVGNIIFSDTIGVNKIEDVKLIDALYLFIVDLSSETDLLERKIYETLYKSRKKFLIIGNKCDKNDHVNNLPIDFILSASHKTGITELINYLGINYEFKKKTTVGLFGKTNVGKSSLFNNLLKENRALVVDKKHTTRDMIEADWLDYTLVDTPGYGKSEGVINYICGLKRDQWKTACDVSLVVVNGSDYGKIDLQVFFEVYETSKICFLLIHQSDLIENKKEIEEYWKSKIPSHIKIIFTNKFQNNTKKIVDNIIIGLESTHVKLPINKMMKIVEETHPLVDQSNNLIKIKYINSVDPFTIVYFSKNILHNSSKRLLVKKIVNYFQLNNLNLKLFRKLPM